MMNSSDGIGGVIQLIFHSTDLRIDIVFLSSIILHLSISFYRNVILDTLDPTEINQLLHWNAEFDSICIYFFLRAKRNRRSAVLCLTVFQFPFRSMQLKVHACRQHATAMQTL